MLKQLIREYIKSVETLLPKTKISFCTAKNLNWHTEYSEG
jgi:hypothetical protein